MIADVLLKCVTGLVRLNEWFESMEETRTVFTDSLTELLGLVYMYMKTFTAKCGGLLVQLILCLKLFIIYRY